MFWKAQRRRSPGEHSGRSGEGGALENILDDVENGEPQRTFWKPWRRGVLENILEGRGRGSPDA